MTERRDRPSGGVYRGGWSRRRPRRPRRRRAGFGSRVAPYRPLVLLALVGVAMICFFWCAGVAVFRLVDPR